MRRRLAFIGIMAALVTGAGVVGTEPAFAYGNTDNPVAQVEISLNCMNTTICPAITGGGEGGFWIWAELDNNTGAGGMAGTSDFTFSGCGHTVGAAGPGQQGGGGFKGEGTWTKYPSFLAVLQEFNFDFTNLFPAAIALTPDGQYIDGSVPYYVIAIPDPHAGGTTYFMVPAVYGHYNVSGIQIVPGTPTQSGDVPVTSLLTAPGISAQTQVAP
jgi:hypothetical protein